VRGNGKKVKWRVRKQARIGEFGKRRSPTLSSKEKSTSMLEVSTFTCDVSILFQSESVSVRGMCELIRASVRKSMSLGKSVEECDGHTP
jgi:hypothetical protein